MGDCLIGLENFRSPFNKVQTMTDALGKSTGYIYTNNTWLTKVTYPDITSENYTYDNDGDVTTYSDRKSIPTTYIYDGADRLIETAQAYGRTDERDTCYTLDALGNKTLITDMNKDKTSFVYNEQNLVRSTIDSLGKGTYNTYDGNLNLHTVKDTRGTTKTMTYDADNRLISVQFSDGTPSISYAYDGDGNRTSMTDAVGNKAYTYDTMNRLLSVNDSARNFNLSYTYDPVGNRLTMLNSKVAGATHYYYYPNNQLQSLTDTDGASVTYIYDAMNNPVNISYPNGEAATYTYVPTNHRLQSIQNLTSHGEALSSFNYVYDNNGNATNITSLSGATAYTYDDLNQLTSALYPSSASGSVSYVYDGVGNQTVVTQNGVSKTKTYNAGNELLSYNGFTFNYDRAGNMVAKGAYPIGISYVWDAMNRLVRISTSSLGTTKGITYVYDGDGHRVQKTTAQGTTNYFYDGSSEVAETDGAGNVLNSFDPGISVTDQQGNKLYYLYNGHGDVAGLMDVNQNLVQSYEYDAFGNTLGVQKDSNHSRYVGLGGVYSDDDASLQNMWNRWYDPTLGRFISRDPIGMAGGMNLYVYVRNNPIKFTDFHGLCVDSSSPYVFSSSTSEAAQNTVAPVDPLAIDSNATPDPESQGVYIGLDASVLGVNASHELIGTNDVSDKTSIVPSVIGADIFVHVGFNNSVMFQNMGPVNSVGFGIGKHGGVVLDPNGIAVGFGASWPPIPISMSANTSSLTP